MPIDKNSVLKIAPKKISGTKTAPLGHRLAVRKTSSLGDDH